MKRTISFMTGKGSVNHNSRKFHAKNTDPERSYLNVEYCNKNVKDVYHELFDEALARYNEKQTRSDRRIDDYYEKIRSGKQEKPFHEIILQIGDKDNMGAKTENGQLAAKVLDKYMQDFQRRNPTLRVFSAYLHMDEATPHLHIDFVPYTTGSRRGLDTRVSLKQALSALGFKGGTRRETELNQWVAYEKEQLAAVMLEQGIEWEKKGTHEKHLSVLDFEKKERAKEVAELEAKKAENVVAELDALEKRYGELFPLIFKSITVDNGSEFANCEGMERSSLREGEKRTKLYYCHPYSAYERGSNENQNKLVRRHAPKGSSFEDMTDERADYIEGWMNDYPRKMFNWHTPEEVFQAEIKALSGAL